MFNIKYYAGTVAEVYECGQFRLFSYAGREPYLWLLQEKEGDQWVTRESFEEGNMGAAWIAFTEAINNEVKEEPDADNEPLWLCYEDSSFDSDDVLACSDCIKKLPAPEGKTIGEMATYMGFLDTKDLDNLACSMCERRGDSLDFTHNG